MSAVGFDILTLEELRVPIAVAVVVAIGGGGGVIGNCGGIDSRWWLRTT